MKVGKNRNDEHESNATVAFVSVEAKIQRTVNTERVNHEFRFRSETGLEMKQKQSIKPRRNSFRTNRQGNKRFTKMFELFIVFYKQIDTKL